MSRTVWITGAAGGLGQALVARLVAAGDRVFATDLDAARVTASVARHPASQVMTAAQDVADAKRWSELLAQVEAGFGGVDVLLNVAGYLRPGRVAGAETAEIVRHLDVNVRGVMLGTALLTERFVAQGRGHVVNVASMAGIAPVPGLALYAASKFAVRGFSLAAAMELRDTPVAVTVVCPDAIDTPMLDLQVDFPEAALTFSGPRVLTADEVAAAIVDDVLVRRPLELLLPWSRGAAARAASLFPAWAGPIERMLRRRGEQAQAARRRRG